MHSIPQLDWGPTKRVPGACPGPSKRFAGSSVILPSAPNLRHHAALSSVAGSRRPPTCDAHARREPNRCAACSLLAVQRLVAVAVQHFNCAQRPDVQGADSMVRDAVLADVRAGQVAVGASPQTHRDDGICEP
jgi:hypothetical protein